MPTIAEKRARFAELHAAPGCFVLPNPFDIGSANILPRSAFRRSPAPAPAWPSPQERAMAPSTEPPR